MTKHAYLIIAHNNFENLKLLIKLLDSPKNDIFIHFDKKAKKNDFREYENICIYSKIYCYSELKVYWGDISQIYVELFLLEKATKNIEKYLYYHLLSGSDLPIKSNEYIYEFFNKNQGKEFINFTERKVNLKTLERVNKYHFLVKKIASTKGCVKNIYKIFDKILLKMQSLLRIDRNKKSSITMQKGANWFSITDDLANYILQKKEWIIKCFKYTLCGDEFFLQTIVENSNFKNNLYKKSYSDDYNDCMREIDWKRGGPYTYKIEDFDFLVSSNKLWARKFIYEEDKNIILKIYNFIKEKNGE